MARLSDPPGLILVDTFATNFGQGSENSPEDMAAALVGLSILKGGGLILSAHHTGHADKTRSRGHSSLYAALDLELQVTQDAEGRIAVGHTKMRDGEMLKTIATFELKRVPLPWADCDGDALSSAVLVKTENAPPQEPPESDSRRIALNALRDALSMHGEENHPAAPGVVSVSREKWRGIAYEMGISTKAGQAQKVAFRRALETLTESKRVACQNDRFWITP